MSREEEQSMAIGCSQLDQAMSSATTGSLTASHSTQDSRNWPRFLRGVTLFDDAVRLRFFLWTLQRHLPPRASLLEVGCGSGTTAVLLADLGYRVTACDIEPELISRLASRYSDWIREGRLLARQADMFQLPWGDKTFDLAYHQGVLEHFPDDRIGAALREQARVSRFVLFDVPNHRYKAQPYGDERLLSIRHWRELIHAAGLELVDERGRDFHHHLYWLPHALFSHRALDTMPWFVRRFAVSSIFVCRSKQ
jgi:SAM-dependent methyltransferase